jgi:hypothetical protein
VVSFIAGRNWSNRRKPPTCHKSLTNSDTKFRQQKLPSWRPILTAGTVLLAFFAIGIVFIPLGVALYNTSEGVSIHIVSHTLSVFHHWLNFPNIFITTVVNILINLINNVKNKKIGWFDHWRNRFSFCYLGQWIIIIFLRCII